MSETIIVLLSGGLDSCTALAITRNEFPKGRIIPVNFVYGQRHARESLAAGQVADYYNLEPTRTFDLTRPFALIGGSSLTSGIREGNPSTEPVDRTPDALPPSFVPGRNIIMLACAAGLAYTQKAEYVVGGWNAVDYSGYPDCRPEFLSSMSAALRAGLFTETPFAIVAPCVTMTKAQIIAAGIELSAPFELTWSCYSGGSKPCGTCDSCKIRSEGFAAVGIPDPAMSPEEPATI